MPVVGLPYRLALDYGHAHFGRTLSCRVSSPNQPKLPAEIVVERDGPVATITLNRPAKLNALTKPMWQGLGDAVAALSADDDMRCIVVRGAGAKSFSPGNDIGEFATERANSAQARAYGRVMHGTLGELRKCRHPIVALIQGICVGGGLEIAALCDLRICGESSRFGAPINKLGLVMAHPEISALLDLVGKATALEILLEGRICDAPEALRNGIVTRVVPDAQVVDEAYATARRIAAAAPLVARWHKRFIRRLAKPAPLTDAEIAEGFACFDTEDFRIGYESFLKKIEPNFVGR
ncbi:MAG: enoyl-CoA hydratase/isomerase family protein [Verrucomicrobia bacterium]|nr:enoyl-CoA hydratase/isomerase family protein [Verrucomicrobiota bacterium]